VHRGILPDVETGEVKAETIDRTAQQPQPAIAVDAAPVAQHDAAPVARRDAAPAVEREGAQKDQWQRIRRHLLNGRLEEAKRDLEDYVQRYPADKEGLKLLEYVKATQAGLKRGR
jgi:TolA-binding protein